MPTSDDQLYRRDSDMTNVLMTVNHSYESLKPLCAEEPVSGLPVAGKTLLEHILEAVVELDAQQITIAASGNVVELRNIVSDGERWGITVNVISAQTNESAEAIYKRCGNLQQHELMIVPCERIYISPFEQLRKNLKKYASDTEGVHCRNSGVTLLPAGVDIDNIRDIDCEDNQVHKIHDVVGYHSANLEAVEGNLGALKLRGKQEAIGLKQGYMTRFHPRSVQSGHVYVGNHCRIHSTCKLSGPVMINHGVSVDRMTVIENSVILDNTIVGEHLHVKDSIVSGNTIVRVDNGAVIELTDKFLISERGQGFFAEYASPLLNRFAGVMLFLVTLPVLFLALTVQFIRSPTAVYTQRTYMGNRISKTTQEREEFVTFLIDNPDSPFRHLPMVLDVVAGNINLFGVSVLTPEEHQSRMDGWQKVTEEYPVGLIGPTQLYVGLDAPLDERLLSDAMSAQSNMGFSGFLELLKRCIQFPFSRNGATIG